MRGIKRTSYAAFLSLVALFGTAAGLKAMDVREALAHFESGATQPTRCAADAKIGSRREVSRFQILPGVWRKYADSANYLDPSDAWQVTQKILSDRYAQFHNATGRDWDAIDLYIMWNAPGQYERAHWDRRRVSRVVMERAERFSNLFHSDERILARAKID